MKNYSVYLRLLNPSCCIKVASFAYYPSGALLDSIARDYSNECICSVASVELRQGRLILNSIDF